MSGVEDVVEVHGPATTEEIAAVLAALQLAERPRDLRNRYEQWRRERIRALRL
jgi:hypothetical protein